MPERTCSVDGCDKPHRARGLCSMHWKREHGKRTKYQRTCEVCSTDYLSDRPTGRFCSDACKASAYRKTRALVGPVPPNYCPLPERHPARRRMPVARWWVAGICGWCGTGFVDRQPNARWCSTRCGRAASEARRGRQFTISPIRRLALYERDGWTCQLCLEPVDRELMALDPQNDWAPSLDHIHCQSWATKPDHTDANLRLAHRWCNAIRGDGRYYTEDDLRISHVA